MSRLKRNDPCWCQSGLKWKHCHGSADRTQPVPRSETLEAMKRVGRRKRCLHFEAGPNTCSGPIVAAHTVQEALLRKIARNGKVYQLNRDPTSLDCTGGKVTPRLAGVSGASTIFAFCEHHDSTTFGPIESTRIVACAEHAALLGYRANCYELCAKEGAVLLEPERRRSDAGLPLSLQVEYQRTNQAFSRAFRAGLDDVNRRDSHYSEILREKTYDEVRFYAVRFDSLPDIMCAGGKNPQFDFIGNEIQDWSDLAKPAQGLSFSLIASGDIGCAFFTWLKPDDPVCIAFVQSLDCMDDADVPHALVRMGFGHIENLYWSPNWWDSLFQETRENLLSRFMTGASPFVETPSNFLCDDGVRAVKWRVTGRHTNVSSLRPLSAPKF